MPRHLIPSNIVTLVLHFYSEGLSLRQIAQRTQISRESVRRILRANQIQWWEEDPLEQHTTGQEQHNGRYEDHPNTHPTSPYRFSAPKETTVPVALDHYHANLPI